MTADTFWPLKLDSGRNRYKGESDVETDEATPENAYLMSVKKCGTSGHDRDLQPLPARMQAPRPAK